MEMQHTLTCTKTATINPINTAKDNCRKNLTLMSTHTMYLLRKNHLNIIPTIKAMSSSRQNLIPILICMIILMSTHMVT